MPSLPIDEEVRDPGPNGPSQSGAAMDLEPIRRAIKGIRFGEVRIVIQDGVVIQIDRMEKQRMR